jgi:hypothetical protein
LAAQVQARTSRLEIQNELAAHDQERQSQQEAKLLTQVEKTLRLQHSNDREAPGVASAR